MCRDGCYFLFPNEKSFCNARDLLSRDIRVVLLAFHEIREYASGYFEFLLDPSCRLQMSK